MQQVDHCLKASGSRASPARKNKTGNAAGIHRGAQTSARAGDAHLRSLAIHLLSVLDCRVNFEHWFIGCTNGTYVQESLLDQPLPVSDYAAAAGAS
jgi:hypothetical protein